MSDSSLDEKIEETKAAPMPVVGFAVDPVLPSLALRPWRKQTTSPKALLGEKYEGNGTKEDPYIVNWLADDAENPLTWSGGKKAGITAMVSAPSFAVAFASSAFVGAIPGLTVTYPGYAVEVYITGMAAFVFGMAIGPFIFGPASEVFGRRLVAVGTVGLFAALSVGLCGAQNIWSVIILRFLASAFGSSTLSNSGGAIADIYEPEQRGVALGVFALSPIVGPMLGPLVSGFLGEAHNGFRWVFALIGILATLSWVPSAIWQPETYPPVLLHWRAERLSQATGKVYRSVYEKEKTIEFRELLKVSMSRPWALLFREPIVFLFSVYLAIVYGVLYLLFAELSIVFEETRGWNAGVAGLPFISVFLGCMFGAVWMVKVENPRYIRISRLHSGFPPTEIRLHATKIGGVALPIGLFIFAWTAAPAHIHWIVSILAVAPFAFGFTLIFLGTLTYLMDAYMIYSASVLAATIVFRSIVGAAFTVAAPSLYTKLGVHWGTMLTALLALACAPMPFVFAHWGPAIRARCAYGKQALEVQRIVKENALRQHEKEMERVQPREAAPSYGREAVLDEGNQGTRESAEEKV